MTFEHRWYYAFFLFACVFLCGFFYFLQPDLNQIEKLRDDKRRLRESLATIKNFKVKNLASPQGTSGAVILRHDDLHDVFAAAYGNGLKIQSMHLLTDKSLPSPQANKIHLATQGYYKTLFAFFFDLLHAENGIDILDFDFKSTSADYLSLTMDVLIARNKRKAVELQNEMLTINNSFCFSETGTHFLLRKNALRLFPINQIKMQGFLYREKEVRALIVLPNQLLFMIKKNDVIGLEQGKVTLIQPQSIHVSLPNKKMLTITTIQ